MESNSTQGRGFVLCYGFLNPQEFFFHENKLEGNYNQAVYLESGTITAESDIGTIELVSGVFTDLSSLKGHRIKYTAGNAGATWIAINPTPADTPISIELLNTEQTIIRQAPKSFSVLCVENEIVCNNKLITPKNYARVLPNEPVEIRVPFNSVAAILTK